MRLIRPRLLQAGPDANLAHLPVSLDLRALSVAEGVRAALSVAVIVAASEWADFPPLGEAALAALLTCLCDAGGPIRRRVPALLAFAAVGASLTAGLGLLRSAGLPMVVPCACLVIFCTSFARIWGQSAMQVGNLLTVVAVLAMDRAISLDHAGVLAASFAGGSLWALLLTMVIWRLHPFRPARRAVAEVFRRMGVLAGDLSGLIAASPTLPVPVSEAWADHARGHRRHVRDGIEAARTLVLDTVRARGPSSARSNQTLIQVEAADQVFGALIALSDMLEFAGPATRAAAARLLHTLRLLLAAIADDTGEDVPAKDPGRRAMVERLLDILAGIGRADAALAGVADALVDRLRVAALLTTRAGLLPSADQAGVAGWRDRLTRPLRANLTWSSASFRHAVRAAAVAGPALVITLSSGNAYAHWLTITLVLTLQPFFALTWQKALERIVGTVLGGVVAAGLGLVVSSPLATAAALFPLAVTAFAVRYVSFGLFMACMTPLVVLLSEIGRPGESQWVIAGMRALYTVLGGTLAVLGCAVLWPSWEPGRLYREQRAALDAHAAYVDTELAVLLGEQPAAALDAVRRAAGVASNNFETSLARALQEPRRSARIGLEAAMVVDAALRRLAGRLSSFQHDPASVPGAAELAAWRDWLRLAFQALADGARLPPGQPKHDPNSAMARIARQIELMDGALRREEGRAPAPARSAAPSLPLPP